MTLSALPALAGFELMAEPAEQIAAKTTTSIDVESHAEPEPHSTEGLIGDLALILLLGAIVTLFGVDFDFGRPDHAALQKAEAAVGSGLYSGRFSGQSQIQLSALYKQFGQH